jgi:hypothetical protein
MRRREVAEQSPSVANETGVTPNSTLDRTAGSHSLAAAGQRERWAAKGWP